MCISDFFMFAKLTQWRCFVTYLSNDPRICIPNFNQISQSTAKILLLPVSENKHPPYLNSHGFNFDLFTIIIFDSTLHYQILYEIEDLRWRDDFILILQGGSHSVTNLFPVSGLATSDIWEGLKLSAYQILTRYLNLRSRYYYFRFLKTNGHHIEILFPVSLLT